MKQSRDRRAALFLLLCGLALLCLLGFAGCGGASQPEAQPTPGPALPHGRLAPLPPAAPPRSRIPNLMRWPQKAKAIGFAPGEAYIDRALKLLAGRCSSFAQELGLFDIDGNGAPELMVITYGTWMRGFELYALSGPSPAYLGWHWGPDGPAWARQTEHGAAWRLDGNYNHGREILKASELFIPTEKGLQVWVCSEDSTLFETPPFAPAFWRYQVEQSLFEDGHAVFYQRREEALIFPADELLEDRAAQDGEGRPAAEQLKENEYPISEMEERMAGSLYRQLLNDGWVEAPPPWITESDVYESGNWNSWLGLDLRTRLRRLYAAWEQQHPAA